MTVAALTSFVPPVSFHLQGFSGWFAGTPRVSFIHRSVDFFTKKGPQNFALDVRCTINRCSDDEEGSNPAAPERLSGALLEPPSTEATRRVP